MSTKRILSFIPTLSTQEANLLIKSTFKHNRRKYGVIFFIIVSSGLTMKSVLKLRGRDFDEENRLILGIKISSLLTSDIRIHILTNRLKARDKLFNVSARRVFEVFKRNAQRVGLDPAYSPYSLRHVFGKHFHFNGFLKGFRKGGAS